MPCPEKLEKTLKNLCANPLKGTIPLLFLTAFFLFVWFAVPKDSPIGKTSSVDRAQEYAKKEQACRLSNGRMPLADLSRLLRGPKNILQRDLRWRITFFPPPSIPLIIPIPSGNLEKGKEYSAIPLRKGIKRITPARAGPDFSLNVI